MRRCSTRFRLFCRVHLPPRHKTSFYRPACTCILSRKSSMSLLVCSKGRPGEEGRAVNVEDNEVIPLITTITTIRGYRNTIINDSYMPRHHHYSHIIIIRTIDR